MNSWERKQAAIRRRQELRAKAVDYLGGQCNICHYDGCAAAFDFHHVDPLQKDFTISERMTSWSAICQELDKCVLLCCRCHREVHDGLHPGYIVYPDTDRGMIDEELDFADDPEESQSLQGEGRNVGRHVEENPDLESLGGWTVHAPELRSARP